MEHINKNSLNLKSWLIILHNMIDEDYLSRAIIYENAVKYLPGSYKLWYNYINEAKKYIQVNSNDINQYLDLCNVINSVYERALCFMNKMPKLWVEYLEFLIHQKKITLTRQTLNRALESLPITQHEQLWSIYLNWAIEQKSTSLVVDAFDRYSQLNHNIIEDCVEYMLKNSLYDRLVYKIIDILNDDTFYSKRNKTKYDYWLCLCDIVSYENINFSDNECEKIIRYGLTKYTTEVAKFWVSLANFYIRKGNIAKSREIFEEAMIKVSNTSDFVLIYNAYLKLEELILENHIKSVDKTIGFAEDVDSTENEIDQLLSNFGINTEDNNQKSNFNQKSNYEYLRINNLLERRPFLISNIELKQNINNIQEWISRSSLTSDTQLKLKIFEEALDSIDVEISNNPEDLYIAYANYLESILSIKKANEVYYKGTRLSLKNQEAYEKLWCEWAEMHIRLKNYLSAREICKRGCNSKYGSVNLSLKLWSFYVDLEEAIGDYNNVINIYHRIIQLKIANVPLVINYIDYLVSYKKYDEAFKIYEQMVTMFTWPQVYDIWLLYINLFMQVYSNKVERIRDLLESVISTCPKDKVKIFYYIYANYEEENGFISNIIKLLEKCIHEIPKDDKVEVFSVLISKAAKYLGITKTREEFSKALELLDQDNIMDIGLKYISMEKNLGEIERARSIFNYLSQFNNPNELESIEIFWKEWEDFELYHGNENTFKEMLKVKRNLAQRYTLNGSLVLI